MSRLPLWLMEAIDELVARWRNNPDKDATVALCAHLRTHPQQALLREVGHSAETWHHDNAAVMLSVGRMYLQCGMLAEAQTACVQSGRVSPKNWQVHRYLGETLLRRGDAARAEKVLQRAIGLGASDSETRLWRERAAVYSGLQKHKGPKAVAREVERTAPIARTEGEPDSQDFEDVPPAPSATRPSRPPTQANRSGADKDGSPHPMPTLYGVGKPPTAESLRAAAHAAGTLPRSPSPEDLLDTLSTVGLYEPNSPLKPAWEAPTLALTKRPWLAGAAAVVAAFAGLGLYQLSETQRLDRVAQAQAIASSLSDNLSSAQVDELKATEQDFKKLFQLDSRNHQAALLWLENRVVHALLGNTSVSGLETALSRARAVGIDKSRLAFGELASNLLHGDSQSAADAVAAHSPSSANSGLFQLVAASLLEQQGNPDALGRYESALRLMPNNKVAHLLAARLAVLLPPNESTSAVLQPALSRLRDTPSAHVLSALVEATTPSKSPENRQPFDLHQIEVQQLPAVIKPLGDAAHALGRLEHEDTAQAMIYFGRALRGSRSALLDHWIARQALRGNLPRLAHRAMTQASERSVQSGERSQLLARTHLALGDYNAAQAGISQHGSNGTKRPELALLAASQAYEALQLSDLVAATADSLKLSHYTRSLAHGVNVLRGRAAASVLPEQLARADQAWGVVIAADLALDRGNLAQAQGLLAALSADSPQVAARRARLRRALGDPRGAVSELAPILTAGASSTRQQIEVVLSLVGAGQLKAARDAVQPGSTATSVHNPWIAAFLQVSQARSGAKRRALRRLALPSTNSPLVVQTLSLQTLTAAGDRRARTLYARLTPRHAAHPDVHNAGVQLGLVRR